ncbi:WXG100 family type VII secretion target [Bacillus cereus]|uniref:WXG100 family type VII secretion target n=1 Tax=Bacillus cereus group TaxID=86661 RepID=UPI002404DD8A|nr:WXG100 family type VII secretion target [Bacillus cereus]MDA2311166.1 WXG100 family type VII secretion target [Bacillus cereus]MDA2316343.1 WXG100 family type VII secretion target [Bacillus cereus]MDA2500076.1 WXG100 family type VII secretion target [Bacillus cereus]MDF9611967.1 WXG100 family type VII secretion target [Bacillus cereus]
MEIKVKPEQLEQIAKNISEMQTHSQNIQQNLNQSMFSIQMQWQGATSQHFYGEYMRSMRLMESYIRNLQVTEKELRRIAQKFRQADEEYQKKQNEKLKEAHKKEKKHEKSWWEKGIEGAAEFIGVNDAIRAVTGKDPITGKELSTKERLIAAGWTLLNFVPVGKVASLAGKGIKYVASSFGKTIVKAGKKLGEGVTMVAGKAGKAAVDGIKTASHKVTEGVNFVASTAKGFADKIGSLWNKGATTVKTTLLQGNEKIQHAVKTLMEYKWIPGEGKGFAMAGVGNVSGGQYSLKEAYQYMESKVVKGTGEGSRIIPGTPGIVTGGNSTKLGKNMMTEMGLRRSTKWSGYQAQHIIPSDMADNPVIKKIGMNFDDSSNGIFLRVPDDNISTMARHRGYHSVYNEVVARALNKMDINQSIDSLQKQVYDLQKNLRKLQGNGLPLYPSQGATVELWERKLKQLEIQNK